MAMSNIEFLDLAIQLMPTVFDGSTGKFQSFLDSLSLLAIYVGDHEKNAVAFIKTRLTGKARNLITTESSIQEIQNTLQSGIRRESSFSLTTRMLNSYQNSKSNSVYAAEIDALAYQLRSAFIREGVPIHLAETYATDAAVKTFSQNARSEWSRLVMEAGCFKTIQEATDKFTNLSSHADVTPNKLFVTRSSQFNRQGSASHDKIHNTANRKSRNQSILKTTTDSVNNFPFQSNNTSHDNFLHNNDSSVKNVRFVSCSSKPQSNLHRDNYVSAEEEGNLMSEKLDNFFTGIKTELRRNQDEINLKLDEIRNETMAINKRIDNLNTAMEIKFENIDAKLHKMIKNPNIACEVKKKVKPKPRKVHISDRTSKSVRKTRSESKKAKKDKRIKFHEGDIEIHTVESKISQVEDNLAKTKAQNRRLILKKIVEKLRKELRMDVNPQFDRRVVMPRKTKYQEKELKVDSSSSYQTVFTEFLYMPEEYKTKCKMKNQIEQTMPKQILQTLVETVNELRKTWLIRKWHRVL